MRLLDFIVIGAPKCGTTTLFHLLRNHPQLFVPPAKEIPFFSDEEKYAAGWSQFESDFFPSADPSAIWGKVTPQYMCNPAVPERMFATMPNAKLVAILRNPVDRSQSHYRMTFRMEREKRTFEEVFLPIKEKRETTEKYVLHSEYGRILNEFRKRFPKEQLQVYFSDDLDKSPESVLASILTFIGADATRMPSNLNRRYNVGGNKRAVPWLYPVVKRITPVWKVWKSLPERQRASVKFWFFSRNIVKEPPLPLDPSLRAQLVDFYRNDVQLLESLIDRKVPWPEFS